MPHDLRALVREVHRQARLARISEPAATRLVKLLYLADLEWRRRYGEPLADLSWRFFHYGPYADEFTGILGGPDVERVEFERGKVAKRLTFSAESLQSSTLPEEVQSLLATLVRQWGDADLNALLDHVYFDTEPMENARRGEPLDFSQLRSAKPTRPVRLDRQKLKELRKKLAERVRALNLRREALQLPRTASEGLQEWDKDVGDPNLPVGAPVEFRTED